mgnify:CR=1 FL=1
MSAQNKSELYFLEAAFQIYSRSVNWQTSHRLSLHVWHSINSRNVNRLYFTCIALKTVVLEMIALIKKWTIKSLGILSFIVRLKLNINQVLILPITMTPEDIPLGKKPKVSWKRTIVWIRLLSFRGK